MPLPCRHQGVWIRSCAILGLVWGLAEVPAHAAVHYVRANAGGASNGTSWADAWTDLQSALTAAAVGDKVWVAAGTYRPSIRTFEHYPRSVTFQLVSGVEVYGGFPAAGGTWAERNPQAHETILSGDLNGDDQPDFVNIAENAYHVVTGSGVDASAVLDGFTIAAGNADGSFDPAYKGGGMYNQAGHPTIRNCLFIGNTGSGGTGIYNGASHPTLTNCVFRNNRATSGGGAGSRGGGIWNDAGSCPLVVNCLFEGNIASNGGGMANFSGSAPRVINCVFRGNSDGMSGGSLGGGICNADGASCMLVNCLLVGNSVSYFGGAIDGSGWSGLNRFTLVNCTVVGNYVREGWPQPMAAGLQGVVIELINCIVWGNRRCKAPEAFCVFDEGEVEQVSGNTIVVNHSCVRGWTGSLGGVGNTGADPLFVRPPDIGPDGIPATADDDYGDLRLQAGSPVADAGDNAALPADESDLDGDGDTIEPLPLDLLDNPRITDDPVAADVGNPPGSGLYCDMGAYEAPQQRILVDPPSLIIPEGGTASFRVRPALNPQGVLQVSTVHLDGDDDLAVESGGALSFDSTSYGQEQVVVIRANPDGDYLDGVATFRVGMPGAPDVLITVKEDDDEPVPARLHVRAGVAPGGDGSSWAAALPGVQDALAIAAGAVGQVGEVWVAAGTYKPTARTVAQDSRSATFQLVSGVALYGGFPAGGGTWAERNPQAHETILSGDLNGDDQPDFVNIAENAYHVVTGSGVDASAVLDGFTVTGGNADGGFDPADKGSGMYSQSGHPTIRNCVFTGNGNDAQGGGGGIFASSSHPTIRDCVFRNNRTNGHGAGICNDNDSHPLVVNCLFEGNLGPAGGGMANSNGSAPRLINCRFLGNSAKWATGGGGGLFNVSGAHPTLVNCVFVGNAVSYWGGAIYNDWWDGANQCTLINCTVAGNYSAISGLSSTNGGGLTGGTFRLTNCVLWGNHNCRNAVPFCVSDQSEDRQVLGSVVEVNHSCIQGWTGSLGGVGNTGADPLFVRPPDIGPDGIPATADDDYGDLRLQAGSPAADAGDNYVDINPDTPGNQPLLGVDLDAHLRRHDDPDAADTGNGAAPIVDMGAYERGSASIPPTLYVRRGASGSNTGTIWADAFTELRVALDTAWAAGPTVTEIWVAASTYAPSDPAGDRTASFNLPNGVQVYGGFTGTETSLDQRNPDPRTNLTILSGDLSGDDVGGFGDMSRAENSYHVATIAAGGPGTVLDGFTITGGYADGAGLDTQGAGLLLLGGRPLLGNLLVVDNSASVAGGGIYSHFSHPTIGDLALDLNASPAGGGGVMLKNWNHVEGTFALNGADPAEPTVLDVRSCQFEGAGWLDLSAAGKLYVSQAPFYEPARFRANLRGTGSLEIAPGQHLILEGAACVDLRIPGTGTPCVDPGGTPGGTILIDGTLLARQESQIRNANITVRQADIQGGSQIQYNDVFLIDAINSGGQLFVEGNATVANNLITSIGDRYLDLDPDPNAPEHPNIDQNTFRVVIETDPALAQGTLLELRSRDDDCGTAANPDCLSGAHPTSLGERFAGEPAQNWVLDTLEIKPGAKLNLTNRPGFEFHEGLAHPEAVYVRHLILHENAVLNTALQTLYYESLTDESGNPLHPAALPGGRRIVDEPLLGFSLGIIAMNDQTASLFNEFDIRVHRRMRDPLDLQPNPPAPALEGSIQLLPNARNPATQDGVMEMRTRAADRAPARSVAAKGAFARAGEEDIVVTFEYLFHATGPGTVLEVYLSDSPRVSERIFKVAELTPPPADLSGGTASSQYGLFVGRFPRVAPQYTLNFTRGTYVELELRGDDSIVWIDNFDPQVWCHQVCANFDQRPGADEMDYLVLLAETGRSVPVGRWCLDLNEDGYVNLGDIQVWEVAYNSRYRCPTWITGACYLPDGRCVIDTELGCSQAGGVYAGNRTGCGQDSRRSSGQGELATGQGSGTSSGTGMGKLRILGKPGSNDDQSDHLYDVAETGLATARSPAPCPEPGSEDCQRGGARLVQDPAGRVYLVHSVYGMLTADTGQILVSPGRKAFQGDIVQVGLDEDGSGLPLSDVAFDPNPPAQGGNGIPESVYVVPLVVTPAGSNHPYTAAARLRLLGNGDFEVATVFGLDPLDPSVQARPENGCLNCRPLVTGGSCRPSCDFSGMREIEVDASGNVFVASATQYNDNDWILVFDESLDSPGHEKARFLLSSLFAEGGPVPPPEGPATLLVSRSSDETLRDHLYLTASVGRSGGLSTRVYRFAIDSGGLGLAFAGAVEIENPPPDICGPDGPLTCDGYVSSITSMLEAPDGRLFTVGWTAPEFSDDAPLPVDRVFTTPTVAAVPPSTAWSAFGPVSRIEAAKIAADDLALPVSAVLLSNAPADFDVDGDVDQDDFGHLQSCATGPEVPQEEETCRDADLDHDGDADQSDFGVFQRCYRGAGKPPDPNCEK